MIDFWVLFGLPKPMTEYKFCETRRWRFDYCWPEKAIAVEIEGGIWSRGRHTRGAGYLKDMEKYNMAAKLGYRVFRFTPKQYEDGTAVTFMKEVL
jgi:hypothetical protein